MLQNLWEQIAAELLKLRGKKRTIIELQACLQCDCQFVFKPQWPTLFCSQVCARMWFLHEVQHRSNLRGNSLTQMADKLAEQFDREIVRGGQHG